MWIISFGVEGLLSGARLLAGRAFTSFYRVYIRHPWESGLDNAPTWDLPLRSITIDKSSLPRYERRDLKKGIPRSQRPSDEDYDRYVYLVDLFRRLKYDEKAKSVRHDIIELVRTWGFHEYFDPYKGTGYGTDNFSWTAALFIDAAMEELES